MSEFQFDSFQVSNVFIAAESLILGCFWVGFLGITLPKCTPSFFSEVGDNVILLTYFSVKALRYIT